MIKGLKSEHFLSREQKIGFVLLFVFGILAVGLGFLQIRNTIYQPFVIRESDDASPQIVLDELTKLQRIDTDQDGLNDYEELNFYQTSPYLPDTDSDGLSDQTEINDGTDPLCAKDKVCGGIEAVGAIPSTTSTNFSSPLISNVATPVEILNTIPSKSTSTSSGALDVSALINDPKQLRALLLSTGKITAAELDKISDENLLKAAKELKPDSIISN